MASVQLCRFYPQWDNTPTEIPNPIRGAIVATWSAGHLQSSKQSPKKDFPRLRELAPGARGSHDAGSRNPGLAFLRDSVHGQKYASSWAQRRSNRDKKCSPSSVPLEKSKRPTDISSFLLRCQSPLLSSSAFHSKESSRMKLDLFTAALNFQHVRDETAQRGKFIWRQYDAHIIP